MNTRARFQLYGAAFLSLLNASVMHAMLTDGCIFTGKNGKYITLFSEDYTCTSAQGEQEKQQRIAVIEGLKKSNGHAIVFDSISYDGPSVGTRKCVKGRLCSAVSSGMVELCKKNKITYSNLEEFRSEVHAYCHSFSTRKKTAVSALLSVAREVLSEHGNEYIDEYCSNKVWQFVKYLKLNKNYGVSKKLLKQRAERACYHLSQALLVHTIANHSQGEKPVVVVAGLWLAMSAKDALEKAGYKSPLE